MRGQHALASTLIALRRTIREVIAEVMRDPDLAKRLAGYGYEPIANMPEEHQAPDR